MNRVKDKVAIVTGGAVGIGRACCIRLAEQGAAVAITDVQDEAGQALASELTGRGLQAA
jgi:NAD(P)-dependent dehydrogenase (short-subunit alcohol dehydrogenase family)